MADIEDETTTIQFNIASLRNRFHNPISPTLATLESYVLRARTTMISSMSRSFDGSVAFIILTLLAFLQLKFQGNDQPTPFSTHPNTTRFAVFTSLFYFYFALIASLRQTVSFFCFCRVSAHHEYYCRVLFADLSVASLASLLFPDSIRPRLYVLFVLLSAVDLLVWTYRKLMAMGSIRDVPSFERRNIFRQLMMCLGKGTGESSSIDWPLQRLPI